MNEFISKHRTVSCLYVNNKMRLCYLSYISSSGKQPLCQLQGEPSLYKTLSGRRVFEVTQAELLNAAVCVGQSGLVYYC